MNPLRSMLLLGLALCGCSSSGGAGASSTQPATRASADASASGAGSVAAPTASAASSVAASSDAPPASVAPVSSVAVPPASGGVCRPFGANLSKLGTFCHGVSLWVPSKKEALPPKAAWKACGTDDHRGGVVPASCETLDISAWVAGGNDMRFLGAPQLELVGGAPRLSMLVAAAGCMSWIALDADGAPVSASTFSGNIDGFTLAAGEGMSWIGLTVAKNANPSEGGETFGCYFVANEGATPPGSKIEEVALPQGWKPDSLGAKIYADSSTVNAYPDIERKLAGAIPAVVGDVAVRLFPSKIEVAGMSGDPVVIASASAGDKLTAIAANDRWIVWTLTRGKNVVLMAMPFTRSAGGPAPVELASWPAPIEGKFPIAPEVPRLGPDHVLANGTLFRLKDGARWSLPFFTKVNAMGDVPTGFGVSGSHVYWTDHDVLRTPITSLGDPTPKP